MSVEGLYIALRQQSPMPLKLELEVAAGELVALVGPSGSGKTTVLRAVAGLPPVRDGEITCNGETWLDTAAGVSSPPQARRVGIVFQNYALFPHLNAVENVMLAMDEGSHDARRRRASELLARLRLQGLEQRYPNQLSGGQQQRVAVARALAREPRVLLLDEPFSAVDMMTRRRLQRELALLRQTIDIPIVLVTHDLDEATVLADRICLLHRGEALQTDTPERLFRYPRSARVARLLGRTNVFSGRMSTENGWRVLLWGGRALELASPPDLADGTEVDWYVPDSDIVLHRRRKPSRGGRENPVHGTVVECVVLGGSTQVVLREDQGGDHLQLTLPTHAARRNDLAPGAQATVSLLAAGIHVMAREPAAEPVE